MNKTIPFIALLLTCSILKAQFKQIGAGPYFEEPGRSEARILLMKNGNTLFVNLGRDYANVRIYNSSYKEISVNSFEPSYKKLDFLWIQEAFETGGDAVLIVGGIEKKAKTLYRLIIDGSNGKLKQDEELGSVTGPEKYMNTLNINIRAKADPNTGNYAVMFFTKSDSPKGWHVELVTYGPDHKEIRRAYSDFSGKEFEYFNFQELFIKGSDITAFLAATKATSDKKNKVLKLISSKKGESTLSVNDIISIKDSLFLSAIIRHNPFTKKLLVLATTRDCCDGFDMNSSRILAFIDPEKINPENETKHEANRGIDPDIIKMLRNKAMMNGKYYNSGAPKDVIFNQDGSFQVIYIEESYQGGHFENRNILITNYTKSGELSGCSLLPRNFWQDLPGSFGFIGTFTNSYRKFLYLNRAKNNYLLINEYQRNIELLKKNKSPLQSNAVSESDAFYFPLSVGSNEVNEGKYVFEKSSNEQERDVLALGFAVYDKENDILVALHLHIDGDNKKVNIVWLKPE